MTSNEALTELLSEAPQPKIRGYTNAEKAMVAYDMSASVPDQINRRIATFMIDANRYFDAWLDHPELGPHLGRMAVAGARHIMDVIEYHHQEHGIDPAQFNTAFVEAFLPADAAQSPQ